MKFTPQPSPNEKLVMMVAVVLNESSGEMETTVNTPLPGYGKTAMLAARATIDLEELRLFGVPPIPTA